MDSKPSWQVVWEKGFQPQFSTEALESLAAALESDDPRLTQGSTTTPPPSMALSDWPVEACCPVTYCGMPIGDWGGFTVGGAEEFFAKACCEADTALGEPAACRWLIAFLDDTPRHQMRSELLAVIRTELDRRKERTPQQKVQEELAKVSADTRAALSYVLTKNSELYERLAKQD